MKRKLTLLFACTLLAASAFAQMTSGTCGPNLTWTFDYYLGLTISGEGEMDDFSVSVVPWDLFRIQIQAVVIEEGVTSIGNYAFQNCTSLTSVAIPNSVTSIADRAFSGCSNLPAIEVASDNPNYSSLDGALLDKAQTMLIHCPEGKLGVYIIPNSVTTIGDYAFYFCTGLTSVVIPNSVTSIGYGAFSDCQSLTSVTIGNSVTTIGDYAFYDCYGLTTITIPNSVTSIGDMAFGQCYGLTSVTIGNSVTSIGDMAFYDCEGLTSITIPNSVTNMGNGAFANCYNLTTIEVASDNPNYSSLDGVVFNKEQTTIIRYPEGRQGGYTIPNSVTSIGDLAFVNCTGLTSVTIPNSATSIGDEAFASCYNLTTIEVALDNPNYSSLDGVLFDKEQTAIIHYPAGKENTYTIPNSVKSIGNSAFSGCSGLTSVTIGNSVTSIGDEAFYYCRGLTSITIPNSVTSIGYSAFSGCYDLTSVTIGNSVISIGDRAFSYTALSSVIIPNSVKSIGNSAFAGCSGLTSVTIGNSVASIGSDVFNYCTSLTSVTIPNSVTSIGNRAFFGCTGLKQVTVEWEIPLNISVELYVFGVQNFAKVKLIVPVGTADLYRAAPVWQDFKIESIELGSDVSATSANVSWYAVENAASYTLTVYSDADMTQVVGAYEFDASGQQLRATQADEKFVAQITGLSPETSYYYKLEAFDSTEAVIDTFQEEFTTLSTATGIENTTNNDEVISTQYYNLQGRIVASPQQGQVYIAKELHQSGKTTVRKVVK